MLRIIRERMQMFAYIHQIGRTRILGTMLVTRVHQMASIHHEPSHTSYAYDHLCKERERNHQGNSQSSN